MKRTWTIIGVGDVPASLKWYQALFGQPATLPAHDYFGQILDSDGTVLLCLHEWGAHEHPSLMSPDHGTPGNGLLLFFRVDDFDLALVRRQSFWDSEQCKLREALARLVDDVTRLAVGVASGAGRWCGV
jgi:catechol 2,3-dioxygenase-like lactoylglutathione lyase family enzyme